MLSEHDLSELESTLLPSLEGDHPGWRGVCAALMGLAGVSCVVV